MTFYRVLLPILLIGICSSSCKSDGEDISKEDDQSQQLAADTTPDAGNVPDGSPLTVEEWMKQGGPNPDSVWGTEELTAAYKTIQSLNQSAELSLPQESGEGKAIFARLVSRENLEHIKADASSVDVAMGSLGSFMVILTQIYFIYAQEAMAGKYYNDETISMMILMLDAEVRFVDILDPFLEGIPAERKTDATFIAGLKKTQEGLTMSTNGAITVLRDQDVFTTPQLEKLADAFTELGPKLLAGLDEEYRAELESNAKTTLEATTNEKIHKALTTVFPSLKN